MVPAGATLVVFGPNGAGKSTLLRVLATLLRPHAGTARVLGHTLPGEGWAVRGRDRPARPRAAAVPRPQRPREPRLPRATARRRARARRGALIDQVGLDRARRRPVHTYSRGMVQRLAVCRAVLHDPEVLLLDEPRANLDPAAAELVEPLIGPRERAHARRDEPRPGRRPGRGRPRARAARRSRRAARARPAERRCRADRSAVPMSAPRVGALLRKELRLELRAPQAVPRWRCSASRRSSSSTSRCSAARSTATSPPASCG